MKKPLRILMGILFPFILILTVTSISKALKPEKNEIKKGIPVENPIETSQKHSTELKVSFAGNK